MQKSKWKPLFLNGDDREGRSSIVKKLYSPAASRKLTNIVFIVIMDIILPAQLRSWGCDWLGISKYHGRPTSGNKVLNYAAITVTKAFQNQNCSTEIIQLCGTYLYIRTFVNFLQFFVKTLSRFSSQFLRINLTFFAQYSTQNAII